MFQRNSPTNAILIPFYIYPSAPSVWAPVIEAKRSNPGSTVIAIINPGSGPGSSIDTNYSACAAALKAAGVSVWGYIATDYGATSQATLQTQLTTWAEWYAPSGMFFDEMADTTGYEAYYTALSAFARNLGMQTIIGNPGEDTDVAGTYVGTVDAICIYESAGLPTTSFLGGWHAAYPRSNWCYIAYTVASITAAQLQALAPYVAYAYVNDDESYGTLPSYLTQQVAAIG